MLLIQYLVTLVIMYVASCVTNSNIICLLYALIRCFQIYEDRIILSLNESFKIFGKNKIEIIIADIKFMI